MTTYLILHADDLLPEYQKVLICPVTRERKLVSAIRIDCLKKEHFKPQVRQSVDTLYSARQNKCLPSILVIQYKEGKLHAGVSACDENQKTSA